MNRVDIGVHILQETEHKGTCCCGAVDTMADLPPAELAKFEIRLGGTANNPSPNTVYLDNLSLAPKP